MGTRLFTCHDAGPGRTQPISSCAISAAIALVRVVRGLRGRGREPGEALRRGVRLFRGDVEKENENRRTRRGRKSSIEQVACSMLNVQRRAGKGKGPQASGSGRSLVARRSVHSEQRTAKSELNQTTDDGHRTTLNHVQAAC